jgi:DNA-binding NarL/FixJ family response regulator
MPLSVRTLERSFGLSVAQVTAALSKLRPREREVADMVADGLGSREIASRIGTKVSTVRVHRANAINALGMTSTVGLVRLVLLKRIAEAIAR